LFLVAGAISPVRALDLAGWSTTSDPAAIPDALTVNIEVGLGEYRIALGGPESNSALSFDDETVSPLFSAPLVSDAPASSDSGASEWDYLWRNASRIPVTAIPEPTTASLLIGGAILLWAKRARRWVR
jgi:hypothetical protein